MSEGLLTYFQDSRAQYMDRYFKAIFWNERRSARRWVLHYGRLVRQMKRGMGIK